jgi:RHS repeat-associated protein
MLTVNTQATTHDLNGNRIEKLETASALKTTYLWNAWDKLIGVQLPDAKAFTYSYDYRTRRVAVAQNASGGLTKKQTAIIFSGGLSVGELESTTATLGTVPAVQYVRGPDMGGGVGGLLYTQRNPLGATGLPIAPTAAKPVVAKFNLSNGRGDIVAQSDKTGALTWTASYEAYGKRTKETGTNADKQRANSKDEDPTGLLNEGFRYRDIETGVWLSRDPAGFVDGPNLYAYVMQNPWTHWDPDGLEIAKNGRDVDDKTKKWNPAAQLYKVKCDPKTGEVLEKKSVTTSAKDNSIKNATIWLNGMANNSAKAAELGWFHKGKSEFYMIHNPSNGGINDVGECAPQRLGFETKVASTTRDLLGQFNLGSANVTSHSQGTMILNKALSGLRQEGKDMRGMHLNYDGAAANILTSKFLAHRIGAKIDRFEGHALDPVHNIVGMNTLNPLRIAGSLIASPMLFMDRDTSPHSKRVGQAKNLSPFFQSKLFHPIAPPN